MFAKARLANLTIPELEQSGRQCSISSPPPNRVGATSTPSNGSSNGIPGFSPLQKAQRKLGRQILDENLPLIIRYQETPTPAIEFRDLSPVTIAQN